MDNIIIFTYSLDSGGVQRKIANLSNMLSSQYKVYILVYDSSNSFYDVSSNVVDLNAKKPPYKSFITEIFWNGLVWIKLIYYKYILKAKVCISMHEIPNYLNVLTLLSKKITNVTHIKSSNYRFNNNIAIIISKMFVRLIYNKSDKIVCVSKVVANDLNEYFNINESIIEIITNPIDLKEIELKSCESLNDNEELIFSNDIIITVGRLAYDKCQWKLIRAFKQVSFIYKNKYNKNIILIIVGDGDERDYLQKIINGLNLKETVLLIGEKTNPYKYIKKSKIFVLTSPFEGYGNVLLEAMACGTPVITTDCLSSRELLFRDNNLRESSHIDYGYYGIQTKKIKWTYNSINDELEDEEKILAEAILSLIEKNKLAKFYKKNGLDKIKYINNDNIKKKWCDLIDGLKND